VLALASLAAGVARADGGAEPVTGGLKIFSPWFRQIPDLDAIHAHLMELEAASGGRARRIVIGHSVEGRDIEALRISSGGPVGARVLITGTQHAREWAATVVTLGIADALVRQADHLSPLVRQLEVVVVPVVNVDGYLVSHASLRMQRKNMNPLCGVDLNRNWDVAFGQALGAARCGDENYPGPAPFSEPETRAVRDLALSMAGTLRLYLDYHSPEEQVMIPMAHTRERPADYDKSRAWAEIYASGVQQLYDTFHPARDAFDLAQGQGGGAIDWFRLNLCQSLAIELRDGRELSGFQLPVDQVIPSMEENWVAFQKLAETVALDAGLQDPAPAFPATGCAVGGQRAAGGWWLALLGVALAWRRARRMVSMTRCSPVDFAESGRRSSPPGCPRAST
jgi:MYXO-CTERM domain-containing protein